MIINNSDITLSIAKQSRQPIRLPTKVPMGTPMESASGVPPWQSRSLVPFMGGGHRGGETGQQRPQNAGRDTRDTACGEQQAIIAGKGGDGIRQRKSRKR
jgi:hypothetical protein